MVDTIEYYNKKVSEITLKLEAEQKITLRDRQLAVALVSFSNRVDIAAAQSLSEKQEFITVMKHPLQVHISPRKKSHLTMGSLLIPPHLIRVSPNVKGETGQESGAGQDVYNPPASYYNYYYPVFSRNLNIEKC
ncbi:uncharacterized protein [Spinacia oleracea]|uniref:Uncharacterized protein isoform X2 n=1 Tax=Spinacia oleracea TaxID=3562 RepID=A0ABM3RK78_SPIOL|nr:uncharacterized protein LOC110805978 isoform X2 [Spinacia oleracea]